MAKPYEEVEIASTRFSEVLVKIISEVYSRDRYFTIRISIEQNLFVKIERMLKIIRTLVIGFFLLTGVFSSNTTVIVSTADIFELIPYGWTSQQLCWLYLKSVHTRTTTDRSGRIMTSSSFGNEVVLIFKERLVPGQAAEPHTIDLDINTYSGTKKYSESEDYCTIFVQQLASVLYMRSGDWRRSVRDVTFKNTKCEARKQWCPA